MSEHQATGKAPAVYRTENYNFDATPHDVTITQSVTGRIGFEVKCRSDTPQDAVLKAMAAFETLKKNYGEKPVKEVRKNE